MGIGLRMSLTVVNGSALLFGLSTHRSTVYCRWPGDPAKETLCRKKGNDGTGRQGYLRLVLAAPAATSLTASGAEKKRQNFPRTWFAAQ